MIKVPKVLIVTHRFWPVINDRTLRLANWIERLNRAGLETKVLTTKAAEGWSSRIQYAQTPVERVNSISGNPFRSHRRAREIQNRLAAQLAEADLVYVDNVDADAATILNQCRLPSRPPVVVRYDLPMLSCGKPLGWQPPKPILDVCRKASAIIVPCAISHQHLLGQGIIHTPILRIEDWHGDCIDRSLGARRTARQILSGVNYDLHLRAADLLMVCPGELSRTWEIELLLRGLKGILESNRRIKLWILGDGPERGEIYHLLEQFDLHRIVAMPGIFTDLEQVLQVADLCVFPAAWQGLSWLAPTCAASNIPMILADSPGARRFCREEQSAMLFSEGCAADLRYKVEAWLRNATPLSRAALKLQRLALSHQENSDEISQLRSLINPPVPTTSCTGS